MPPLRKLGANLGNELGKWKLLDVRDDGTASMNEVIRRYVGELDMRCLVRLVWVIVDEMKDNRATGVGYAVTGEMEVVKAHALRSNENKMSDGWRESASLRVEGGISWKVRNQSCQPFAPSHG